MNPEDTPPPSLLEQYAPQIQIVGTIVTVLIGLTVLITWFRQVRAQIRDAAAKKKVDEEAAAKKIEEMDLSKEELYEQIGNQLLLKVYAELDRSNEIRQRQEKQLETQGIDIKELRYQVDTLQAGHRVDAHNFAEAIRHIERLEGEIPTPPGPPDRPVWRLLPRPAAEGQPAH